MLGGSPQLSAGRYHYPICFPVFGTNPPKAELWQSELIPRAGYAALGASPSVQGAEPTGAYGTERTSVMGQCMSASGTSKAFVAEAMDVCCDPRSLQR